MEEQLDILELVPQPGFRVRDGKILHLNQAAQVLLLSPGQEISPLLKTGREEYAVFSGGQLYLTLELAGQIRNATVTRTGDTDLFLLESDGEQEEFRSMELVSMELRSPLMNVITNAQQLLEETENRETAAKLNRGLAQLLRLTSNLSDVGRYREISHMETRDICTLVEELLEKSRALMDSNAIHLSWELPREAIFCLVDTEQLERALWNLLSNAVKFLPNEGSVHVKLTRHGQRLHLSVADNGSGIAEQVRSTVFQRYLRQPGIEDSRFGLGLGIHMIHAAARNHGGTLLITQGETGGTRVILTLAIRQKEGNSISSPIFRVDYTGGFDHSLVELSDCLPAELFDGSF